MSENLSIYNQVKEVPQEAKKEIKGGRLSGMTDINPMWRVRQLTELFGPCGFGWSYEITEKRLEQGANDTVAAFVDINLYVKHNDEWSKPIPGTGGSAFVAKERSGLHTSDECFKMAMTDAISVACKALGFGADVYWEKGNTKYDTPQPSNGQKPTPQNSKLTEAQSKKIYALSKNLNMSPEQAKEIITKKYGVSHSKELSKGQASEFIEYLGNLKGGDK